MISNGPTSFSHLPFFGCRNTHQCIPTRWAHWLSHAWMRWGGEQAMESGHPRFSTANLLHLRCRGACVAQFMMTQSKGGLFSPWISPKFGDFFFELSIDKISLVSVTMILRSEQFSHGNFRYFLLRKNSQVSNKKDRPNPWPHLVVLASAPFPPVLTQALTVLHPRHQNRLAQRQSRGVWTWWHFGHHA